MRRPPVVGWLAYDEITRAVLAWKQRVPRGALRDLAFRMGLSGEAMYRTLRCRRMPSERERRLLEAEVGIRAGAWDE